MCIRINHVPPWSFFSNWLAAKLMCLLLFQISWCSKCLRLYTNFDLIWFSSFQTLAAFFLLLSHLSWDSHSKASLFQNVSLSSLGHCYISCTSDDNCHWFMAIYCNHCPSVCFLVYNYSWTSCGDDSSESFILKGIRRTPCDNCGCK
jgi:hypothetical protein